MSAIQRRRARSTGTTVTVLDAGETRDYELDESAGKYGLICEDHAGFVCVPTLAVARAEAAHPEEWCPTCQESAATRGATHSARSDVTMRHSAKSAPENDE